MQDNPWHMAPALVSYPAAGTEKIGLVVDGNIHDAGEILRAVGARDLVGALCHWRTIEPVLAELAAGAATTQLASRPLAGAVLGPPLVPGTIYCAGANYVDHIAEMARVTGQTIVSAKDVGEDPWFFLKARSAVVGPGAMIALPRRSLRVDYEVELAVVIGVVAKDVSVDQALDYVAGYTIADDVSVRDVGRPRTPVGSPFYYDWISMKNFDGACPLGPGLVPARFVEDPQHLAIELWVNDERRQSSNTDQMIFSIAEQIAWLSSRLTLHPGDVVLTGTPAGVALASGRFLRSGDSVRVRIESLGEMSHTFA